MDTRQCRFWEGGGYRRAEIAIPRVTASPISRRSPESASCSVSQWIEISQFNAMPSLVRGRCPPAAHVREQDAFLLRLSDGRRPLHVNRDFKYYRRLAESLRRSSAIPSGSS